jgi:hypothetical protein
MVSTVIVVMGRWSKPMNALELVFVDRVKTDRAADPLGIF